MKHHHYYRTNLSSLADRCICMKQAKQVHAQMIVSGRIHDNYAGSRIIAFCALSADGDLGYAIRLFRHTHYPNSFMCNTIIRALAGSTNPEEAILLYCQMKREGMTAGKHTFPFLLKACSHAFSLVSGQQVHTHVVRSGFDSDAYVCNALLLLYLRCSKLDFACRMFDETSEKNVVVWTTMISGYAQNCLWENALTVFGDMVSSGLKPNEITLSVVLSSCARCGNLEFGERVHSYLKTEGIKVGVVLGTALVDMYAKNGKIGTASEMFDEMPERNTATWNALICGLAMHGHAESCIHLYFKMKEQEAEVLPNAITFVGVLSACCHAGMVGLGKEIFDSMHQVFGMKPTIEHYGCMVDLLGRAGCLEEAEELVKKMDVQPDVVVLGALLGACRAYNNIEIAERVVKQILSLEPYNHGVYVVLSNMYAEAGKWENVVRLRNVLAGEGLKKMPGLSLVEFNV